MIPARILLFILVLTFGYQSLRSQNAIFLSTGKIEFEKRINQHALLDENNSWTELEKKAISQFKTTYFDLLFTRNKCLYKPGREVQTKDRSWGERPAQENVVYSDLDNGRSVSQKKVFEQLFLVQDSTRRIRWKITDENRVIAGFNCRRANAIIMDSIYVVAFYTDEILAQGGPESFTGLPGMILGVALPHQHVTWFATKVEAIPVSDAQVAPPAKGKKVDNATLYQTLKEVMKDWGKDGQVNMQATML
jgi:GLPGLI family protein